MAASWHGGSYTKICLAAALAGSVGLALYYGYRKRQQTLKEGVVENKQKQDETKEKEAIASDFNKKEPASTLPSTDDQKSSKQPVTENLKEIFKKEKPQDLKLPESSGVKEKTEEIKSSVKSAAEDIKSSAKAAAEKVKEKTEDLKSSIDTSLTDSSFSFLGGDKEDTKEKQEDKKEKKEKELSTKYDNDIVVIEETHVVIEGGTQAKKETKHEETIVPESTGFAQSLPLPSLPDQPPSLSAFELSSLETQSSSISEPKDHQPQSLSTYEFPSLEHEKSKPDNGSDIEVLPTEDKSKPPEKAKSDTPPPSHIPKAKKDSKKLGANVASSSEASSVEATKDVKSKGRKGSKDAKRKDETDGSAGENQKKGKETDEKESSAEKVQKKSKDAPKAKPPPVPPKPKVPKPDTASNQSAKDQEVHIRHPTNRGEFVSFGMKFESPDSTPDHIITGIEDGGPASEVGLQDGDMILKLNDMDVTHWSRAVLIEQFRMIPSAEFDLTVKRNDQGKYFSVHIMDEADGVAVSGVVIDVNSIPKSNLISVKAVEGSEAVQKCHVVSYLGACAQVNDEGLTLQEKLVDDESFTFEKINFKDKDSNIVILKTYHKGSPVYVTVLNRTTIGVQYDLEEDVKQLETADSRCFYLIKTRGGSFWLESTQFPDHYLCCKGNQFVLLSLTQASEVATNRSIRFKFEAI